MNLSPSSQMIQLAMLETIRALRSEVELEVDHLQSAQEESDTEEEEEEEEDMAALYQRMNISRRMSLPANLPLLRQDDTHRRLQALQRATGAGFREDDDRQDDADEQQEEMEEVRRDSLMMAASPMYADPGPSDSDVGSRSMRGPAGLPDVLSDSVSRSSSKANPLPDLVAPEAPLSVAADCPDSSVIYRHPPTSINNHHHQNLEQTSINALNSDQRVGQGRGWVGIAQGLERLAGTTTIDKGFLDQRRKSCFVPKTTSTSSSSSRRRLTRRRSVAGTGWMENTMVLGDIGDNQGGIFRDICAIVGIFGFYMCVRKIESLLK